MGWDPISAGNLGGGGIPYLQEAKCGILDGGNPISAGNLVGGDPISAGNLDGGDPISAGNLDPGGSHICRKPRWGGIPCLQETCMWVGSHISRKPRWGGDGGRISVGNLDGCRRSHICRKPRGGGGGSHICRNPGVDPISAGDLDAGDPISAGNLDGDPIYAGNLQGRIPYPQET